jgi:mRNA-degrading endonuclease RelE of RelBE toxin-antitoxin system
VFKFDELDYTEQFDDSYRRLQERVQKQCDKALDFLLTNPDHPGLNLKPIKPAKIYWEVRVNKGDRLIIRPDGATAHVMEVVTHDDSSKWGG